MPERSWTDTDLAYFAGILDGEGCFALRRRRGSKFDCNVLVANTDLRLISWLQTHFGGRIDFESRTPPQKNLWHWTTSSHSLTELLEAVLPFLVIKRDRAELMLAYRATLAPRAQKTRHSAGVAWSSRPTTDAVKQERANIHAQLSVLNKRGVAS